MSPALPFDSEDESEGAATAMRRLRDVAAAVPAHVDVPPPAVPDQAPPGPVFTPTTLPPPSHAGPAVLQPSVSVPAPSPVPAPSTPALPPAPTLPPASSPSPATEAQRGPRPSPHRRPLALLTPGSVHGLTLVGGFFALLAFGRGIWFAGDDFDFLSLRGLHHAPLGLFVPHNEHWSTIPILLWRAVYSVVGLRHYGPYLALMIIAHLITVHLVWRISRHLDVQPWVATAIAGSAVLLGVGWENLLWAFQVGFIGSLAFGLGAVLVALRLGRGWSQGPALLQVWALSIAGLMCSGVGVTMVIGTALVAWVRRGLRPAILSATLPTLVYAAWYEAFGKAAVVNDSQALTTKNLDQLPAFVANGFTTTLGGWVDIPDAGAALLVLIVIVVATRSARGVTALPLALVATTLIFYIINATGRIGFGVSEAGSSRYSYIAMMLMFPAILVGLDQLTRRGGLLVPSVVAVLLVLSSSTTLDLEASARSGITQANKQSLLASAVILRDHQPLLGFVPQQQGVRIEIPELIRMAKDDKLPSTSTVTPQELEAARAGLQLVVTSRRVVNDQAAALLAVNGVTVVGRSPGCVNLRPDVPAATVTIRVESAVSTVSVAVSQESVLTGNLQQLGESIVGPFALALAAGTNWLRVSDAGSLLTVILPANQVSTFCGASIFF